MRRIAKDRQELDSHVWNAMRKSWDNQCRARGCNPAVRDEELRTESMACCEIAEQIKLMGNNYGWTNCPDMPYYDSEVFIYERAVYLAGFRAGWEKGRGK